MDNSYLIDTNLIRRLLEDKRKVFYLSEYVKKHQLKLLISDLSLWEIIDQYSTVSIKEHYLDFVFIINTLNLQPIYNGKVYNDGFNFVQFTKDTELSILKNYLFPSIKKLLSPFLVNTLNITLTNLATSLETDYSSEFYQEFIQVHALLNLNNDGNFFENILNLSYIENSFKLKELIHYFFNKTIIDCILAYKHSKKLVTEEFLIELNEKYHKSKFNHIANEYITKPLKFNFVKDYNDLDKEFLINYMNDIIVNKNKFSINDLVDYINFKYAYDNTEGYLSLDNNFFKKLKRIFIGNSKVLDFIKNSEIITFEICKSL